ncbi:hypothetical protein RND61_28955 [Streptomyces sp. TRM76323]|uniref:Uncharacterized protein n=1 Tax=Streptomyces tamarix TaxID=3078565 RepID=A0ABU3QTE8_9ACTN|nr:hypothetical protein [Streptomyces tamarix]MDT9686070.1 hypothetical protein [Streptomyces tamarix]
MKTISASSGRQSGRVPRGGLGAGEVVSGRQAELLLGEGRHPDADWIGRELLAQGKSPARARRATVMDGPCAVALALSQDTPRILAGDFLQRPVEVVVSCLRGAAITLLSLPGAPVTAGLKAAAAGVSFGWGRVPGRRGWVLAPATVWIRSAFHC